ncbi:MAG TPA: SPOR domain-containing protein [Pseudomonas xinjiangensis]|uniref:SPOR domain-containing protein n=2 Tax=root TaxID=1 RepID=A0A7V1BPK4_9GAMM|nr:SPOR domain-containing protein [Halopseudomonas xinjiangensis]HEC48336.1 SPOR domain-containing protein [Halopseudomonas xinjiangensis]
MAKGRKPAPRRGASRAQAAARRGIPPWLWMISGLVIGLFVAFLFQLEPGRESVKRDVTPPKPPQQNKPAKPAEPRYDFYTLLPESEVIIPQSSVPETAPPEAEEASKPKAATRFFLQAGSFRQRNEADRVRAQILMLGLDVQLESAKLAGDETWYRVQVGPFQDRNSLSQAQQTLAGNGFENLLLQQRTGTP